MSRSLRSCSRQKKLQVEHIQQVNRTFRVNINSYIESNVDNFNQMEFLSLFGLTKIAQSNGNQNGRTYNRRFKRSIETANRGLTRSKRAASPMVIASHAVCKRNDDNAAISTRCKLGKIVNWDYGAVFLAMSTFFN